MHRAVLLRRRFLAAHPRGGEEAAAARTALQPGGVDDLAAARTALYRPDADPDAADRYAALLAAREERDRRSSAALAVAAAAERRAARRRAVLLAAAGAAVALAVAAGVIVATRPPDVAAASRSVPLVGSPAEGAALRAAIARGDGDRTALVTRTAYRRIPVLARTNRAAGNEATLRGDGVLLLDPLESLTGPRAVTVLVLCARPTTYAWSLDTRDSRTSSPTAPTMRSAHGEARCGRGLDAAVVHLPAERLPSRLRMTAPDDARYLLSVQVTG